VPNYWRKKFIGASFHEAMAADERLVKPGSETEILEDQDQPKAKRFSVSSSNHMGI
jgi:hypothetical protein